MSCAIQYKFNLFSVFTTNNQSKIFPRDGILGKRLYKSISNKIGKITKDPIISTTKCEIVRSINSKQAGRGTASHQPQVFAEERVDLLEELDHLQTGVIALPPHGIDDEASSVAVVRHRPRCLPLGVSDHLLLQQSVQQTLEHRSRDALDEAGPYLHQALAVDEVQSARPAGRPDGGEADSSFPDADAAVAFFQKQLDVFEPPL
uniref:Uncharacterized protein n=1 Tax=Gasterosteus aculeatus TaxID=69293 RepID=G3NPN6_GASAC